MSSSKTATSLEQQQNGNVSGETTTTSSLLVSDYGRISPFLKASVKVLVLHIQLTFSKQLISDTLCLRVHLCFQTDASLCVFDGLAIELHKRLESFCLEPKVVFSISKQISVPAEHD